MYGEPLLVAGSFIVCGMGSFPLAPQALQVCVPRERKHPKARAIPEMHWGASEALISALKGEELSD